MGTQEISNEFNLLGNIYFITFYNLKKGKTKFWKIFLNLKARELNEVIICIQMYKHHIALIFHLK